MTEKKTTKKTAPKKKSATPKISESDKTTFPYSMFPVKVIHKDGKDLSETKICYFQNEKYAQKYILQSHLSKKDYQMFVKSEGVNK